VPTIGAVVPNSADLFPNGEALSWPLRPCGGKSLPTFPLVRSLLVGATGFEPVTSSVSESAGWWWRPAADGQLWPLSWEVAGPLVTVVVRCDPVARGPDVAPLWPQRSTRVTPILTIRVVPDLYQERAQVA
jgi:hypothetical protein